jgi:1,4-dihydroxy-2-naphthoate octaprenyltransferase
MRWGMALVFGLALAVGVYLTKVAGVPIVLMGTASILSAIAYTGGPWPLGYHGLGDLFVFVFFGLVAVCGTVFVSTGGWSLLAVLAAVPVGALATGVLVVNNVRDHETDVHAGKRTLVVRFGRRFGVGEYVGLVAVAYAVPVLLVVGGWTGTAGLLPLLTVPLAVRLCVGVGRTRGASLNAYLGGTAKLLFAFGVLFAVGIGAVNK